MRRWWGWIAPFGTALLVVVLVVGVHTAMTGGSAGGGVPTPDGDDRVARPTTPAEPVDLPGDVARVTGYHTAGRRLVLSYRLRYPDCQVIEVQAAVVESLEFVQVRLQQAPVSASPRSDCTRGVVHGRISVELLQPMLYRAVVDAGRDDHSVPRIG